MGTRVTDDRSIGPRRVLNAKPNFRQVAQELSREELTASPVSPCIHSPSPPEPCRANRAWAGDTLFVRRLSPPAVLVFILLGSEHRLHGIGTHGRSHLARPGQVRSRCLAPWTFSGLSLSLCLPATGVWHTAKNVQVVDGGGRGNGEWGALITRVARLTCSVGRPRHTHARSAQKNGVRMGSCSHPACSIHGTYLSTYLHSSGTRHPS